MSKEIKDAPVFVYNGFADLELRFDGRVYRFPYGKVTRVESQYCWAPDDWKRNHESDPDPGAILEKTYSARKIAEMLLNRHHQNLIGDGVVCVRDGQPTEQDKQDCNEFGRIKKMQLVEEALADRRQALAKGGKPTLDRNIVQWMKDYSMTDELYNPKPSSDVVADLTRALSAVLAQQQPVPAIQPVTASRK